MRGFVIGSVYASGAEGGGEKLLTEVSAGPDQVGGSPITIAQITVADWPRTAYRRTSYHPVMVLCARCGFHPTLIRHRAFECQKRQLTLSAIFTPHHVGQACMRHGGKACPGGSCVERHVGRVHDNSCLDLTSERRLQRLQQERQGSHHATRHILRRTRCPS